MFDVIRDFLLEPALLTVALLLVPALALVLLAGAPRRRGVGAVVLGEVGCLVSILAGFSWSVLGGNEDLRAAAWVGCVLAWWLALAWVGRLGRRSSVLAALLSFLAWGLDTFVTSAILFE